MVPSASYLFDKLYLLTKSICNIGIQYVPENCYCKLNTNDSVQSETGEEIVIQKTHSMDQTSNK